MKTNRQLKFTDRHSSFILLAPYGFLFILFIIIPVCGVEKLYQFIYKRFCFYAVCFAEHADVFGFCRGRWIYSVIFYGMVLGAINENTKDNSHDYYIFAFNDRRSIAFNPVECYFQR